MAVVRGPLTWVRGVLVGHAEDPERRSGVTVARFDAAAPTVVAVRGGASATYDTASLALEATYGGRWAIFFAGGSLFGLDAAHGVREAVLAAGGGHSVFRSGRRIAPVSGAALFDLPDPGPALPDYRRLGREAAERASRRPPPQGAVGAGTGATVGKYLGRGRAMRGGVGHAGLRIGRGAVGALVAVNAVGAVQDPATGRWVAGARGPGGRVVPPPLATSAGRAGTGTTLALVVTDWALPRTALARVADIASAGLARAIVPYQSATDGDVVFAVSTGAAGRPPSEEWPGQTADRIGSAAASAAVAAVLGAARAAHDPTRSTRGGAKRRGGRG